MRLCRKLVATASLLLLFLLLSSFLIFSATASFSIKPTATASFSIKPTFSIIWITDTQFLSERFPRNFDAVCNWIADYSQVLNVKAVIHTGDIVEHPESIKEWNRANHSMSILLNNNIPYCWNAGNHDQLGKSWLGKNFTVFNTTTLCQKNYWISYKLDGKNTALHFKVSDWDFLVINTEFEPSFKVLKWVNQLLELYPNYHTILATHAYLNGMGEHEEWTNSAEQTYFENQVLAIHSNVFMTLNGHYMDGNRTSRVFTDNRHELFFNYQQTGGEGDATLRILTFSKEEDTIFVNTVNTVTNRFLTDPDNCFTLDIPFIKNHNATENLNPTKNAENLNPTKYEETETLPEVTQHIYSTSILIIPIVSLSFKKRKSSKTPNC